MLLLLWCVYEGVVVVAVLGVYPLGGCPYPCGVSVSLNGVESERERYAATLSTKATLVFTRRWPGCSLSFSGSRSRSLVALGGEADVVGEDGTGGIGGRGELTSVRRSSAECAHARLDVVRRSPAPAPPP
jgi:hypothetical protein